MSERRFAGYQLAPWIESNGDSMADVFAQAATWMAEHGSMCTSPGSMSITTSARTAPSAFTSASAQVRGPNAHLVSGQKLITD